MCEDIVNTYSGALAFAYWWPDRMHASVTAYRSKLATRMIAALVVTTCCARSSSIWKSDRHNGRPGLNYDIDEYLLL